MKIVRLLLCLFGKSNQPSISEDEEDDFKNYFAFPFPKTKEEVADNQDRVLSKIRETRSNVEYAERRIKDGKGRYVIGHALLCIRLEEMIQLARKAGFRVL